MRRPSFPRSAPSWPLRFALVAAAGVIIVLGHAGCERHAPGEPALWYGHGSGHDLSKPRDTHSFDGAGARFSDSQGTEVKPPEEEGERAEHLHPETGKKEG